MTHPTPPSDAAPLSVLTDKRITEIQRKLARSKYGCTYRSLARAIEAEVRAATPQAAPVAKVLAYPNECQLSNVIDKSLMPGTPLYAGTPEGSWQPIETAPKDGTAVLVVNDKALDPEALVAHWNGEWRVDTTYAWANAEDPWGHFGTIDATHWMPLPPAPRQHEQPTTSEGGASDGK